MKKITIGLILSLILFNVNAQKSQSPYEWDWTRDGIWTAAALAGTAGGVLIIGSKESFTPAEIASIRTKQNDINFLDKWVAGNYDENASKISDIPFYTAFAAPFALLLDDDINDHAAQVFGIYIESLATTSTLFTITAGLTNRARPYVYNLNTPQERIESTTATRSFYSGHVAATSTATFFAAKVFQDFNPDSAAVPYVWTGAIVVPAAVGYFRMKAGQHFLTDVLLGYSLGALAGYYITELHKRSEDAKVSFYPTMERTQFGDNYQALTINYTF